MQAGVVIPALNEEESLPLVLRAIPRSPLAGVEEAVASAQRTYIKMGAEAKLGLYLQPNAGHVVTPVAELVMADWLVKWLAP